MHIPPSLPPDGVCMFTRLYYCSSRPWSFFIIFCVFLIFVAAALPFILGRVIDISTRLEHQLESYTEATIWGDLSESDIAAAESQLDAFTVSTPPHFFPSTLGTSSHRTQDYVRTWTLASFTDRSSLPTATRMKYGDDNVYFAELTQSQLKADGKGLGTFLQKGTIDADDGLAAPTAKSVSKGSMLKCVSHAGGETENSCLDLVEYHVGESGCIAKSSQNPRSTCKQNNWSGGEHY